LVELFKVNIGTKIGKVLIAMALHSWERVYDAADLDQIATAASRPSIARIAQSCLYNQRQILASLPSSLLLGFTFLHTPPWEAEPWKTIAEENTPGQAPIPAPVLVVQGEADHIVDAEITKRFVEQRCAEGQSIALQLYPGVGHLATGNVAAPDVTRWIADRFAGKPAPTTC
ncbi:MAG: lipase family protein, partial [Actinobacteria bacterium]|nr:lipase family protein [Actinomycetota bacterium]